MALTYHLLPCRIEKIPEDMFVTTYVTIRTRYTMQESAVNTGTKQTTDAAAMHT
jgi:hypothetical protein